MFIFAPADRLIALKNRFKRGKSEHQRAT